MVLVAELELEDSEEVRMRPDLEDGFSRPHDDGLLLLLAFPRQVRIEAPSTDAVTPGIPFDQVALGKVLAAALVRVENLSNLVAAKPPARAALPNTPLSLQGSLNILVIARDVARANHE